MTLRLLKELKSFAFTRYERIQKYLKTLEDKYDKLSKQDKETIKEINLLLEDRVKRLKRLHVINGILYVFIYFSFVSILLSEFVFLEQVKVFFKTLISIFGTAFFFLLLFLTTRLKDLYYQDLILLSSHSVSIYSRYNYEDEHLFKESNSYSEFLKFFKKRGF
jgi:hypothetical protein